MSASTGNTAGSRSDDCPACGGPTEYVCGPDGNGGAMHCWTCYDADQDTTVHEGDPL